MNNTDLEKTLYRGKNESDAFFSNYDYAFARNAVQQRISRSEARKAKPLWPFSLKVGFVAALMVCAAAVMFAVVFTVQSGGRAPDVALSSQTVSLDKGNSDLLLNYFKVKEAGHSEPGLMSVLWELGKDDSQMVYSTVFEKCKETYPASMIPLPDKRNLMLIFSGDSSSNFIDYRLIGYSGEAVNVWWSQDYVQGGNLDVRDGVIVERRDDGMGLGAVVSHIVPYDVSDMGEVLLPAENVQLRVGELILLVGSDAEMLEVSSQNGLFERIEQGGQIYGPEEAVAYRAKAAGDDVLLLKGNDISGGHLEVSVTE